MTTKEFQEIDARGWTAGTCEAPAEVLFMSDPGMRCAVTETEVHPDAEIAFQLARDQTDPRFENWGSLVHQQVTRWPTQPSTAADACGFPALRRR